MNKCHSPLANSMFIVFELKFKDIKHRFKDFEFKFKDYEHNFHVGKDTKK